MAYVADPKPNAVATAARNVKSMVNGGQSVPDAAGLALLRRDVLTVAQAGLLTQGGNKLTYEQVAGRVLPFFAGLQAAQASEGLRLAGVHKDARTTRR